MKKINQLFIVIMILGTITFMITSYDSDRLLTYLAIIPVLFAPYLLKKTKYKLTDKELFAYYFFVFFADFIGCIANLYNTTSWYDIFVHFSSGIFTFGIGLFLLKRIKISNLPISFQLLFCISIGMLIAGLWEFLEFTTDNLLNMDLQHQLDTGVGDTMQDMLFSFFGNLITMIIYVWKKKSFGKKKKI